MTFVSLLFAAAECPKMNNVQGPLGAPGCVNPYPWRRVTMGMIIRCYVRMHVQARIVNMFLGSTVVNSRESESCMDEAAAVHSRALCDGVGGSVAIGGPG